MRGSKGGVRLGRRDGWFYAVWSDPEKGTQRSALRTKDREVAERVLADFLKKNTEPKATVSQIMEAYMDDRDHTAASPARIRDAWKRLKPHFGALRPDQVDRMSCRSYRSLRAKDGAGDGTIRTELQYLRAGLRFNDKHTRAIVELPRKPPPKDRVLSRPEYDKLLEEAKTYAHLKLYVMLGATTAGRPQAILQLKWDRVDFDRGIISLGDGTRRRKGRATVPMTDSLRAALEDAQKGALTDFVVEWGGGQVKSIKKGFASAAKNAGFDDVTPYVLRHTAAVWMAEAGVPMSEIAQYLGHEDSQVTERVYAKYGPEYLRRAAKALP